MYSGNDCWKLGVCEDAIKGNCNNCIWLNHIMYFCERAGIPKNRYYTPKLNSTNTNDFERYNKIKSDIVEFVKTGQNVLINVNNELKLNDMAEYGIKILLNYFSQISNTASYGVQGLFIDVPQYSGKLMDNIQLQDEDLIELKQYVDTANLVVFNNIISVPNFVNDIMIRHFTSRVNNKLSTIVVKDAKTDNAQTKTLLDILQTSYSQIERINI